MQTCVNADDFTVNSSVWINGDSVFVYMSILWVFLLLIYCLCPHGEQVICHTTIFSCVQYWYYYLCNDYIDDDQDTVMPPLHLLILELHATATAMATASSLLTLLRLPTDSVFVKPLHRPPTSPTAPTTNLPSQLQLTHPSRNIAPSSLILSSNS